ncbi:MAG: sulfotransferase [Nitriliruptorales bacterium]
MLRLQTLAARQGFNEPPRAPVFLVGCPRSGTSMLFDLLRRHEALQGLTGEGHILWSNYQHPRRKGWASDRATAEDIAAGERGYLYTAIRHISQGLRFIDKTPKNVLRLPYLAALFPDATFVFIKRDGPDTVSSLIEGWQARRGISYRLPTALDLAEYRGRLWSYILPPGWRERARSSFAEVAALQYVRSNETALVDRQYLPAGSWVEVAFERLVAEPVLEVSRLLERFDLPPSERVLDRARHLNEHPVGAVSPPRPEKWRDRAHEIGRIIPQLKATTVRLGYEGHTSLDLG